MIEASDADEAIAILENASEVKLLFSDVDMPGDVMSWTTSAPSEASRVFRRLLSVRRSYDERYKEQVFA